MNIEGEMISVYERDEEFYMTMKVDEELWAALKDYAIDCCEDYDEHVYFHYEFLKNEIELNVTSYIKKIEKKYFSKGNKMTKFPFRVQCFLIYNPKNVCFDIVEI